MWASASNRRSSRLAGRNRRWIRAPSQSAGGSARSAAGVASADHRDCRDHQREGAHRLEPHERELLVDHPLVAPEPLQEVPGGGRLEHPQRSREQPPERLVVEVPPDRDPADREDQAPANVATAAAPPNAHSPITNPGPTADDPVHHDSQ